jgi:co-chaperonin GroES (HSP10)
MQTIESRFAHEGFTLPPASWGSGLSPFPYMPAVGKIFILKEPIIPRDDLTAGGLFTAKEQEMNSVHGVVLAASPFAMSNDGTIHENPFRMGDYVLLGKWSEQEINIAETPFENKQLFCTHGGVLGTSLSSEDVRRVRWLDAFRRFENGNPAETLEQQFRRRLAMYEELRDEEERELYSRPARVDLEMHLERIAKNAQIIAARAREKEEAQAAMNLAASGVALPEAPGRIAVVGASAPLPKPPKRRR